MKYYFKVYFHSQVDTIQLLGLRFCCIDSAHSSRWPLDRKSSCNNLRRNPLLLFNSDCGYLIFASCTVKMVKLSPAGTTTSSVTKMTQYLVTGERNDVDFKNGFHLRIPFIILSVTISIYSLLPTATPTNLLTR